MTTLDSFNRANLEYVESLYQKYRESPDSVDAYWKAFFQGYEAGAAEPGRAPVPPGATRAPQAGAESITVPDALTEGVRDMVHSYRELGHVVADVNPLSEPRERHPLLDVSEFGLSEADLERPVISGGFLGQFDGTLRGLIERLKETYCESLGVEYLATTDKEQRTWLQDRMEPTYNKPGLTKEEAHRVLEQLMIATEFEQFLHKKYVGQKRFSLEGGEALIPMLEAIIDEGGGLGGREFLLAMAHRGRLNVLTNVVQKPLEIVFSEFEGTAFPQENEGDGDVKYHLGFSCDRPTPKGNAVHLSLTPNPSHLELVDPVLEGIVRAKQEHRRDTERKEVIPIIIHGEAAFTGQGIVAETLSLSQLEGYRTGGTIHIIVNNQVGFTASPRETRFTRYPTDMAKVIPAPIFHVNAEDPEAVVHAARLAIGFRQAFKMDVMLDLWCYRKYGHNETDDPTYTQPLMYKEIEKRPAPYELYAAKLLDEGKLTQQELTQMREAVKGKLNEALTRARELHPRQTISVFDGLWRGLERAGSDWNAKTSVDDETILRIADITTTAPSSFNMHPKLKKLFAGRAEMAKGKRPVDWGTAESWAFGSLLLEGTPVRLTGQDCERGTFSHRHAVLHDVKNGERYIPLTHLSDKQAKFTVVNTMLSEEAVLGFEYGYSYADPLTLVLWEAQFGDFVNGAQAIIDQFIVSSESKWQRMCGLVLLLPHGYEGQGPEHSSARLERFLQLAAQSNVQVAYPSLPSQYFHILRRQMLRKFRKPLILMTPKSLLRLDRATSRLEDFTHGGFRAVIDDPELSDKKRVKRIALCTGKVYYTLQAARDEAKIGEPALIRVEQLYPFPVDEIRDALANYPEAREILWVQEEPRNMGAWTFVEPKLRPLVPPKATLSYRGRDEAASPAVGWFRLHEREEAKFVRETLGTTRAGDETGAVRQSAGKELT